MTESAREFPPMREFPESGATGPNAVVETVIDAFGILAAQDGDDLSAIWLHMALGRSPQDGFASVRFNADSARTLAAHLEHLAKYAELKQEAPQP